VVLVWPLSRGAAGAAAGRRCVVFCCFCCSSVRFWRAGLSCYLSVFLFLFYLRLSFAWSFFFSSFCSFFLFCGGFAWERSGSAGVRGANGTNESLLAQSVHGSTRETVGVQSPRPRRGKRSRTAGAKRRGEAGGTKTAGGKANPQVRFLLCRVAERRPPLFFFSSVSLSIASFLRRRSLRPGGGRHPSVAFNPTKRRGGGGRKVAGIDYQNYMTIARQRGLKIRQIFYENCPTDIAVGRSVFPGATHNSSKSPGWPHCPLSTVKGESLVSF